MRFTGICIITDDVVVMRDFYRRVLEVEAEGNDTHTRLLADGGSLCLFSSDGMEGMAPGSTRDTGAGQYTIEVEVADVDRQCERLKNLGVTVVKPPTTQPWGRRSAWFRDPCGNIVNLYTSVDVRDEA